MSAKNNDAPVRIHRQANFGNLIKIVHSLMPLIASFSSKNIILDTRMVQHIDKRRDEKAMLLTVKVNQATYNISSWQSPSSQDMTFARISRKITGNE